MDGSARYCQNCSDNAVSLRCSSCKEVYYCSKKCQKGHWPTHKLECKSAQAHAASVQRRVRLDYDESQPCYPFEPELELEIGSSTIGVIRHLCAGHPHRTRTIVIFFPGVHGGVGPCRTPGRNFCENALYPTLAKRLVDQYDIDCYRCSWPCMRPRLNYAVRGGCRILQKALEDMVECNIGSGMDPENPSDEIDGGRRRLRVFFVGHSLGGMVAVQAAVTAANHFVSEDFGDVKVDIAGFCTLNGAVDARIATDNAAEFECLSTKRALLIAGDSDAVVPPEATEGLYEVLPIANKRHLVLAGGEHDLYTCKQQLLEELEQFLTTF